MQAYPNTADAKFQKHWYVIWARGEHVDCDVSERETWFTQDDVNAFVSNGINTVRIPVSIVSVSLDLSW